MSGDDLDAHIIISNLTKHFGKTIALESLNLKINKGEVVCVLGHNGAGKTTFI